MAAIFSPPTEQQRLAVRQRPEANAMMYMRWEQLLFLHWACDPAEVQRTLPPGLWVDTFDGRAWVGLVPLFMRDVRPVGLPAVPGLSDFLEFNVRTYAYDEHGVPGVWFYSLDCDQVLAVEGARRLLHLNYELADMAATVDEATGGVDFRCRRRGAAAESHLTYCVNGAPHAAPPESLEFFLIERYVLFAHDEKRERIGEGRVSHAPYEIRGAEVTAWDEVMFGVNGLGPFGREPDHVCGCQSLEVAATPLRYLT